MYFFVWIDCRYNLKVSHIAQYGYFSGSDHNSLVSPKM